MREWEEKDLKFLLDKKYFPECIICGAHYFHKSGCYGTLDGATAISDAEWNVINDKLNQRLKEFEEKYGEKGSGITCKECGEPATGELHILYHGTNLTVESWPVCMNHAFHETGSGEREAQYRGL